MPLARCFQRHDMLHVAAKRFIVLPAHGELYGRDKSRRWHVAEGIVRQLRDIGHDGDAATGPDIGRRTTAGNPGQGLLDRTGQLDRVFSDTPALQ